MRLVSRLPALLAVLANGVAAGCGATVPARATEPRAASQPARDAAPAPGVPRTGSASGAQGSGSTISGLLSTEDGHALTTGAVTMIRVKGDDPFLAPTGDMMILPDGSFSFRNVPPGSYQIRARGETEPGGIARFAMFNVVADGRDVTDITMVLIPGATVAGTVIVHTRTARPADLKRLRVRAPLSDGSGFGEALTGNVLDGGAYAIRGLMPGIHVITIEGLQDPWVLKEVTHRGQDVTDAGLDVNSRQRFDDVRVTITDEASEVSGIVRDGKSAGVPDATVAVVPLSQQFWTRTSRRLRLLHADGRGRYRVRGLPPGEYRAVASTDVDGTSFYKPDTIRALIETATPFSLSALEARVLDLPLTSKAPR